MTRSLFFRLVCAVVVVTAIVGGGVWFRSSFPPSSEANVTESEAAVTPVSLPLPDLPASEFQNSAPEVSYVGTAACVSCHQEQHDSYQQTAHSQALSTVDPTREPRDGTFLHAATGRSMSTFRKEDRLVQSQSRGTIVEERPVKYLVGLGRHSRTYLIEDDGFLAESPITWFASRSAWEMSPGYDSPQHAGFERAADTGCLVCHVGRMETMDGSPAKIRFHEQAIGCESCHGPGGLHVQHHSGPAIKRSSPDRTIVHPGRLSRDLEESICAACHLRGDATVYLRGRSFAGFRPGLPLASIRTDYFRRSDGSPMKVVGHVEQMHLSRCYQGSATLTCTTCHDPHTVVADEGRINHYRQICLECHSQSCKLPEATRRAKQSDDDCTTCHMPRGKTDIPHIAFTHHRISVPGRVAPASSISGAEPLHAFAPTPGLAPGDVSRGLGLAYLEVLDKSGPEEASRLRRLAREELYKARAAGAADGEVWAALARLAWELGDSEAESLARLALREPVPAAPYVQTALVVLGDLSLEASDLNAAHQAFSQLTQLRRHSEDWHVLGQVEARQGKGDSALRSFRRAVSISPFRIDLRQSLVSHLRRLGQVREAAEQERLIRTK